MTPMEANNINMYLIIKFSRICADVSFRSMGRFRVE